MTDTSSLTYKQKVLLHLRNYQHQDERKEKSEDVTQEGISENVGVSRTHLSRVLGSLNEEDLIEEKLASVAGHDRQMKTYSLTSSGLAVADRILDDLSEKSIDLIKEDIEKTVPLSKIEEETDGKLDLLTCISLLEDKEEERLDLREHGVLEPLKMVEDTPSVEEFYGREKELEEMKVWMESDTPVLAVLGRKGLGASALTAKFIRNLEEMHVLWINLKSNTKEKLKTRISNFLEEIGAPNEDIINELTSQNAVVVLDDYYEIEEEVVSFLKRFLEKIEKKDSLKLIITGREGTPVYERFYRSDHVENGLVEELNLSSLGKEEVQQILDKDIKEEALERIMMFTKGSPLLLKFLREGNEEKLCELTPWEEEQISLLMYLKTETKE